MIKLKSAIAVICLAALSAPEREVCPTERTGTNAMRELLMQNAP